MNNKSDRKMRSNFLMGLKSFFEGSHQLVLRIQNRLKIDHDSDHKRSTFSLTVTYFRVDNDIFSFKQKKIEDRCFGYFLINKKCSTKIFFVA